MTLFLRMEACLSAKAIQVTECDNELERNMASIFIPPFNVDEYRQVGTCVQTVLTINNINEVSLSENFRTVDSHRQALSLSLYRINEDEWTLSQWKFKLDDNYHKK